MTAERRVVWWAGGIAVFILLLWALREVLTPFVVGLAVAYFLDPLVDRLEKTMKSRTLAVSLVTVVFFLLVLGLVAMLVPLLQGQVVRLLTRVPVWVEALMSWVKPMLVQLEGRLTPEDLDQIKAAFGEYAGQGVKWAANLLGKLARGGAAIVDLVTLVLITPLVSFYLLRDWDRLVAKLDGYLPRDAAPVIRARMVEIDTTISGFLRGQASVCFALGTFYAVGLTLVGLDFGLLVGLGAGLISFIPYFGTIVGLGTGLGLGLAQFGLADWQSIAMVAAVFGVGQVLEGNILTPKLVGDKVGLHAVWIIFALLAGASLFGFAGVVLAVPVAAVIGVLVRHGVDHYLESPLYHGGEASQTEAPGPEESKT